VSPADIITDTLSDVITQSAHDDVGDTEVEDTDFESVKTDIAGYPTEKLMRACCCCSGLKDGVKRTGAKLGSEGEPGNTQKVKADALHKYKIQTKVEDDSNLEKSRWRWRQSYHVMVKWRRGVHNVLYTDENQQVHVPIYVSLLLIGGYITVGALMFGLWEDNWTFLIGSYFCFVTLSTIGFGDFVPGSSLDPTSAQEKLILCSLYLIFGLALLAMCFDLMQEEVRNLFRSLAKKIGLVVDPSGII